MLSNRLCFVAHFLDRQTKACHGHRVEQRVERPKLVVAKRAPLPVAALRDIRHDRVKMQVRLLVAVGVVLEKTNRQVVGCDLPVAGLTAHPGLSRVLFCPAQGLDDGLAISIDNPLVAAHQREQRPAFRE